MYSSLEDSVAIKLGTHLSRCQRKHYFVTVVDAKEYFEYTPGVRSKKRYTPGVTSVKCHRKMPLRVHWAIPVANHRESDKPSEDTTDNWRSVGRCHWRSIGTCHWKSLMISEVSISGVQYLAPQVVNNTHLNYTLLLFCYDVLVSGVQYFAPRHYTTIRLLILYIYIYVYNIYVYIHSIIYIYIYTYVHRRPPRLREALPSGLLKKTGKHIIIPITIHISGFILLVLMIVLIMIILVTV